MATAETTKQKTGSAAKRPETATAVRTKSRSLQIGHLTDSKPDTMTLHTRDAYRLFTGCPADPAKGVPPIPGARRFAAILKAIWHLSENDNPYADWILVQVCDDLAAIRTHLQRATTTRRETIDLLKRKGLALSVMGSRNPKPVRLEFGSPYGYAAAETIVEFDHYVRIVRTLLHKDRISDQECRAAIREIGSPLRALFLKPIRWERYLLREELQSLSRRDFLPAADDSGRQRVRAAVALFGEVPRKILTGAVAPRHTRRRTRPTDLEMRLLAEALLTPLQDPAPCSIERDEKRSTDQTNMSINGGGDVQ